MDLSVLLTPRNGLLVVVILAVIQVLKAVAPKLFTKPIMVRLTPVLPILLGFLLGFCKLAEGVTRLRDHLVLGVVVGFAAANLFKLGRTTVLGWGVQAEGTAAPAPAPALAPTPASPPAPAPVDSEASGGAPPAQE